MLRTLCLATALGLILPTHAYTLGLGGIEHKSFLNQKFNADIELLSINKDEMDTVKIGLASAEAFAKAGVDRAFHLHGLRFEALYRGNESAVIHVSSQEPIREPFLDFLVEVRWSTGQLLREYTVLLDPPNLEQTTDRVQNLNPSLTYGPVTKKDTLWSIAKKMRQPGTSVTQVINALLAQNPDAFINANPNNLLEGKTLQLRLSPATPQKQAQTLSVAPQPIAVASKSVTDKTQAKKIPQPATIKTHQPPKPSPTEINKLWESLQALHQSEQHRFEQTQALFKLIEELNFKVGDIQLMLIEQNQTKTVTGNENTPADERAAEATSPETIIPYVPTPTPAQQTINTSTLEPLMIKHETSHPVTASITTTKNKSAQQAASDSNTSLQIGLSTFVALLLLLKAFLSRRNQVTHKTDDPRSDQPVLIDSESSTEPPTDLLSTDETSELPPESSIDANLKEWEADVDQELNQLLEQVDSIENDTKTDTDYIAQMVTTIQSPVSQPLAEQQDIADYLEEPGDPSPQQPIAQAEAVTVE